MDSPTRTRPFWLRRLPWVLLLLAIAGAYFGSYYRHGISFQDEGGTITLLAKRLKDGEVPFRDVVLGYNVGWFFPIGWLFKLTGVNFVALRIYFLALSTLAAILGFLTVERAARHVGLRAGSIVLGMITGLLLIAVPGMIFKNYNPLAAVANSWCLLGFVLAVDGRDALRRVFLGGLVLGATWLVRIDLGTFFTVLWLGTIFARLFEREWKNRAVIGTASVFLLTLGIVIPHVPVVIDARSRGYFDNFIAAYPNQWVMFGQSLTKAAGPAKTPPPPAAQPVAPASTTNAAPAENPAVPKPDPKPTAAGNNDTLARTTWSSVQAAKDEKQHQKLLGLFLLTYLPLLSLLPLALGGAIAWFRAISAGRDAQTPLAALVLVGGALTMFPQYFFWRPDAPHLSEFGPGFWVATLGATALLGAWGRSWAAPARWMVLVLLLHSGVWFWRMLPDRTCGTVWVRDGRKVKFEAKNGVRVFENQRTVDWLTDLGKFVEENSAQDDYLVAYPYHPSFNVIYDRPTYEKNVYIDNVTGSPRWCQDAIARIKEHEPQIIIISGWKINNTEASQFKNWAAPVYAYVRANYNFVGLYGERKTKDAPVSEDAYEVFLHRDAVPASPR